MNDLILDVANLHFSYRNRSVVTPVLHGVDLQIPRGEFLVIVGPSGCGKSTLMHLIGLMATPDKADRMILDGHETTSLGQRRRTKLRRQKIGFIFQRFNLMPVISAAENIDLALRLRGVTPNGQAREILETVGMADVASKKPGQLSIGQQQRVAIARAVACDAPLLLADEPTGNLDSNNADKILDLFRHLQDRNGQTTVMITHNPAIAEQADRVIRMRDGRFES